MPKTEQKSVRLTPETVRKIEDLGRIWGPYKPMSFADTIAVMTDLMHAQKTGTKEKAR